MTIIAGFVCDDGLLFAADTKHSHGGVMHLEAGKIFTKTYEASGGHSLFALTATSVHYAKMLIQHCEDALGDLEADAFTLRMCRQVIEDTLRDDYANYIFPHPEPRPGADFLIGIFSPVDGHASLFSTEATSVNWLPQYDCRGQGAYLGHFLLRDRYLRMKNDGILTGRAQGEQLSALVLEQFYEIKQHDDGCGHATDLCWMAHDGALRAC